jgi:putative membrane-bound dehydrogenase-like protein
MRVALLVLLLTPQDRRPLDPGEALKAIRVEPGWQARLAASEPDIADPVAIAFDERGRMYVAEMRDYPQGPAAGRISLLEPADGRYGRTAVFADGLAFPTSVLPWRGGVFATVAYEILWLKDTDGDGKADERKTVFTGFGRQNSQHLLNGLQLRPDGWVYGSAGLSGGKIGDVSINGTDFRFHPDTLVFEPVTGRSQFGHAFDDYGRRFFVRHDNHSLHAPIAHRYLKAAPDAALGALEENLSDHGNIPRLFPISPRDAVFTTDTDSSCGIAFRGGELFVCEPVLNLVHRDTLVPAGASFRTRRGDAGREWFASSDPTCRPVNVAVGPDGGLWVVDMVRGVIEHPDYIPREIRKKLDARAGLGCGRVWRVTQGEAPLVLDLATADDARLARALGSANPWERGTAQRLALERKAAGPAREALKSDLPSVRAQALELLHALKELSPVELGAACDDASEDVREVALRLFDPSAARIRSVLAKRPSERLLFQAALSLVGSDQSALIAEIASRSTDPWTRNAVVLSASKDPVGFLRDAIKADEPPQGVLGPLGQILARRRDEAGVARWLELVLVGDPPGAWQREALAILPALRRAGMPLPESPVLRAWSEAAQRRALKGEPADRIDALALLGTLGIPEGDALLDLLQPREPQEVQAAAVRLLAPTSAPKLFEGWARFTPAVRGALLQACLERADLAADLLGRVERAEIDARSFAPHQRETLLRHPDAALRERAKKLLRGQVSADREEAIREVSAKVAALKGDAVRGSKVFETSCLTCHRLRGRGVKVGPDLEGVIGRDRRALLVDLLDPNRAMDPSYQVYVVKTGAGELLNGVIAAETPGSVTLRRAAGEETTVLRKDIVEMKAWPASLMPEGVESSLSGQDFADLLEFLSPAR